MEISDRELLNQLRERKELDYLRKLRDAETIPEGNVIDQVVAPARSIAGNLAGSIAGGWAGAVTAPFVGIDEANKNLNSVRDTVSKWIGSHEDTEQSRRGMQILENSMRDIEGVINFATGGTAGLASLALNPSGGIDEAQNDVDAIREQGLSSALGDDVFDRTGSPEAATVASLIPVVGEMAMGNRSFGKPTPVKSKLLEKIESSPNNPKYAHLAVVDQKVITNKFAKEAIKQGFDESVIGTIKNASKSDKVKMLSMIDNLKSGRDSALYAAKNRPADVAGNSLLERVNFVKSKNREFGAELETVAKSLKGKPVSFDSAMDKFKSNLSEMGIDLDSDFKPKFSGSDIEGVKGAESAIKKVIARLSQNRKVDAYEVHRVKRFIDEQVSYNKSVKGLSGKSERVLKELRRDLDSALDTEFPKYDAVNKGYADTVTALDELQLSAGRKLDLFGDNADKATGTLLRRLLSNAQGRVTLMDAIDSIESVGKKYGSKFDDDITTQVLFVDELDRLFGTPSKTSFQGEIVKGTDTALSNVAEAKVNPASAVIKGGARVYEKARGINKDNAIKSMEEFLRNNNE